MFENGSKYCSLTTGITCQIALKASEYLKNKHNVDCGVCIYLQ